MDIMDNDLDDEISTGKRVVEYLDEVDYSDLEEYIPSTFAIEMVNFIKMVNNGVTENKTPVVHLKMIDNFLSLDGSDDRDTVNMCHRGIAKTTLQEYLILYLGVYHELPGFGPVPYGLYVSDSMDNGVKKMRKSLELRYNNSKFLQDHIPKAIFIDNRWEFINADGKSVVFSGHGAKTGVRGTRENNSRPVLALLDDLISDEDANSATIIEKVEDTVYSALEHAMHIGRRKVIWSGTPFNERDPLYKAVESGAWRVNIFPVCEKFPCTREEFKGSWEDRFTYDAVCRVYLKAKRSGKLRSFYQELMLRIMSDEDRMILKEDVNWYNSGALMRQAHAYNFYITTDFATSEKESADFSVIVVWAYNSLGQWFLVDGICKKQGMAKNIDDLFRLVKMYNPKATGVEVSGQQAGFMPWIQQEMIERTTMFILASDKNTGAPGIRPVSDKFARFQVVEPLFKAGMIFLPDDKRDAPLVKEAVRELELVTYAGIKSKNDDVLDNISQLPLLNAWRPSADSGNMTHKSDGIWEPDAVEEASGGLSSYTV